MPVAGVEEQLAALFHQHAARAQIALGDVEKAVAFIDQFAGFI